MAKKVAKSRRPSSRSTVAKAKKSSGSRKTARKESPADRVGRMVFVAAHTLALDQTTCAGHVFGETSVLSENPDKLEKARRFIAGVAYKRNGSGMAPPKIPSDQELQNPNTKAIWDRCMTAASQAANDDVKTCKHFVIWFSDDDGKTPSKKPEKITDNWPYEQADKIKESWGPFTSPIKPKGKNIFVIKYCGVP